MPIPFPCPRCGSSVAAPAADGEPCCPSCRQPFDRGDEPTGPIRTTDQPPAGDDSEKTGPYLPPPAAARSPDVDPPPGYELLGVLGRGGMGVVYKARQTQADRVVALKMIRSGGRPDDAERARFRTEAEAVARLNHPGIVQVYEVGEWDGQPFLALEYCPGGTLAAAVAGTPLAAREAAALTGQLAVAVAAAHAAGVAHRDLKPVNVLLAADGSPKVADFGLALRLDVDDRQTQTGAVMGTPSYMAPEQALGDTRRVGAAADVYALGAVLYELLTGRPPFKGATVLETLDQVRTREPVPPRQLNPQVPRDLETVCLKCLRKEPERRYAGARALADDLARFAEGRPVTARPVGRAERAAKWVRRNPLVSGLAVAVAVSVLAGLIAFAWQFRKAVLNEETAVRKADEATAAEGRAQAGEERAKGQAKLAEERAEKLRVALEEKEAALAASERARSNGLVARADQAWRAGDARIARQLLDEVPPARRGWAWNYLERTFQGGLFTAYGLRGPVAAVAFSPDGTSLAAVDTPMTADAEPRVCVWDATTGVELPAFRGGVPGRSVVAFAPDGRSFRAPLPLAAGGAVRQWDVTTGRPTAGPKGWAVGPLTPPAISPDGTRLAGLDQAGVMRVYGPDGLVATGAGAPPRTLTRPAFSPDGGRVALAARGGVRVWDAASGALLRTLAVGKGEPTAVAFSPDGLTLAAGGSQPGGILLWDARTWEPRPPLTTPNVYTLTFSPDGEWLAVAVGGATLLLDSKTGAEVGKLRTTTTGRVLAFSPDGQRLACGSDDHTVRVWDLRSLAPAPVDPKARPVSAEPDRDFTRAGVLTADDRLRVIETESGAVLDQVRGVRDLSESTVALSPDGTRLAYAPRAGFLGRYVVLVRSIPDKRFLRPVQLPTHADAIVFSPDGTEVSVISPTDGPDRGIQRGWPDTDRRSIWEGSSGTWGASALAYSPDGRAFAAGFEDGKIRVWDRASGRLTDTLLGHSDRVNSLAFSRDSRRLVSGGRADRSVIVWDFPARRPLLRMGGHENGVAQVVVSPDGESLASLGSDGEIKFWDAVNGQQVLTLDGSKDREFKIAFSADGGRLLGMTGGGRLVQWEGTPAPSRRTLRGHDNKIAEVAFSPDGRTLASVAIELKWWDAATGRDLFGGDRLNESATSLAFRPDGRQLGFTTIQGTIQVWDVVGQKLLAELGSKLVLWRLALSPKEGVLATWDDSGTLTVWEFPPVTPRFRVPAPTAGVPDLAFSADGQLVTVTDARGARQAFDATTGRPTPVPGNFRPALPPASAVSPGGDLFALPEDDQLHLVALRPEPAELDRRRRAARVDIGWQDGQAARHEAAKNWFAAAYHLKVILDVTPGDQTVRARRDKAVAALAEAAQK